MIQTANEQLIHWYFLDRSLAYLIPLLVLAALPLMRQEAAARRTVVLTLGLSWLFAAAYYASMVPAGGGGVVTRWIYVHWVSGLVLGICAIYLLATLLFRVLLPLCRIGAAPLLQDLILSGCYVVWGLFWLSATGVNLASIIATSTVLTAVIGFSLQDTLGNILAGVSLEMDGSVRVGDWIKLDELTGRVIEIRWRHILMETRNWETVVIPNSRLARDKFMVLGRRQGQPVQWRRWVYFNVDFRTAPTRVIETVEQAMKSCEIAAVARDPAPNCILVDFAESYGKYAVRYWLKDLAVDDPTDSQVRAHIYFALQRAGIKLSIPAQSIFVTEETAERDAEHAQRELSARATAIQRVDLFRTLRPQELDSLAQRLVPAPFAAGDVMTRQGAEAHWLYILVEGEADVVVENGQGLRTRVATLEPGSVYGEMSLVTGQPRPSTVIARTAVECYRLDRDSFQDLVQSRPAIADEIASLVARRRAEVDAALENLDAEEKARILNRSHHDILARIQDFLGLSTPAS